MSSAGLVSIIIPVYNAAAHAAETLKAVFAQTYPNFEVIVADDGSEDRADLERVLRPFENRITYIRQQNQGCGAARNLGLQVASGEFCAFLDSDDIWFAEYLAEQIAVLRSAPATGAVYCDALLFGDQTLTGLTFMDVSPSRGPVSLESLVSERTIVQLSFCLVRRQCVSDVGGFDGSLRACEDFDLWVRMSAAGRPIAYHRKVLGRRRVHPSSLSSNYELMIDSRVRVYEKLAASLETGEQAAAVREQIARCQALLSIYRAKRYIRQGDVDRGLRELEQTLSTPSTKTRLAIQLGNASPTALRLALGIVESDAMTAARLAWFRCRTRIRRIGWANATRPAPER